jgi:acid phosphatase (class A)
MNHMGNVALRGILLILVCVAIITGCASIERVGMPVAVPEICSPSEEGYLPCQALPDSVALLPPPDSGGSASLALDEEVSRKYLDLRGTPRWELAKKDAVLEFPKAADTFSCVLNAPITKQDTPHLYKLLCLIAKDAGNSTKRAKDWYNRTRPFVVNNKPICTPDPKEEAFLRNNGSYPSGHAAIGWVWALILAEIVPEQTDKILARGLAFGESRMVCNVHWQSDVIEGRLMGAAVIARLHADPQFCADVNEAKKELANVREKGLKPTCDCKAETEALVH